jgi:tetratricopeptide (TPR) repeat protein
MLLKEPNKAQTAFAAALVKDAQNPDLLYNSALAAYDNGNFTEAASLLSRMPGLESSAPGQSLYGDVDEKLGDYKEAADHYVSAVQLDPSESNVYSLGLDFLRHWSFEPAEKELEAGVKQFPSSARMRFALGLAYYGSNSYDRAIPVFAVLLNSDSKNAVYADMLGMTCAFLTEGLDPHCSVIVNFAEQHPRDAMIATYAATSILHRQSDPQQFEKARRLLDLAIQHNPALPEARYAMGLLLQEEGQWQQSIPEMKMAVRNKPDYAQAHYRLAIAYSHTGQKEQAKSEMALQRKYSEQASRDLDTKLNQITTLLVSMK